MDNRNGKRQRPHSAEKDAACSSGVAPGAKLRHNRMTMSERKRPSVAVV